MAIARRCNRIHVTIIPEMQIITGRDEYFVVEAETISLNAQRKGRSNSQTPMLSSIPSFALQQIACSQTFPSPQYVYRNAAFSIQPQSLLGFSLPIAILCRHLCHRSRSRTDRNVQGILLQTVTAFRMASWRMSNTNFKLYASPLTMVRGCWPTRSLRYRDALLIITHARIACLERESSNAL